MSKAAWGQGGPWESPGREFFGFLTSTKQNWLKVTFNKYYWQPDKAWKFRVNPFLLSNIPAPGQMQYHI